METVHIVLAGCFGLVTGSFLNVVIWRLPRGESLVHPGSHCPGCDKAVRWFDNIPLLSWLALRGRCRSCGQGIAFRYPLVEVLTGVLFALAAWHFPGDLVTAVVVALVLAALVAISFIDWDHKIIPDRITRPGIVLGILVAPLTSLHPAGWLPSLKPALAAWLHAGAGAAVGAVVILAIRALGSMVFRKEAMGLGDVKLLAFIGAFVGPLHVLYALVLACVGGAVFGILRLLWSRGRPQRIDLTLRQGEEERAFDRVLVDDEDVEVRADAPIEEGRRVAVQMTLPAAGILEDEDAEVTARGRVVSSTEVGRQHRWRVHLEQLSEDDRERLAMIEVSWKYVPFGPFLALGGAALLLFGDRVHWLITEGYPEFARSLFGG